MEITASEFFELTLIFICVSILFKSIEFLVRRSRNNILSYRYASKIERRLDVLEGWMGMDKEEKDNDY